MSDLISCELKNITAQTAVKMNACLEQRDGEYMMT